MSMMSFNAYAYDCCLDGIYYVLDKENNEAKVTFKEYEYEHPSGYDGKSKIVIPSSITYNNKKYSVTSIGPSAFEDCTSLTFVTIPNSVTSIDRNAFHECSWLAFRLKVRNAAPASGLLPC